MAEMCNKIYQAIIIGAGVSGLSAANFLVRHGIVDILVLEGKTKPGGRIDTEICQSVGDNENADKFELGAHFLHGEENAFFKLVKSSNHLHHLTSWEGQGDFLLPNGTKIDPESVSEILDWVENTIGYIEDAYCIEELQNNPNQFAKNATFSSMGKFLKDRFRKYLRDSVGVAHGSLEYDLKMALFQWAMSFQRIDNSCNQMTDLSLFRWSEFQVNPGEHYSNFKNGASQFVDQVLVGNLPVGVLHCNCPVENIAWDRESVTTVKLRNGQQFQTQMVLVTCSIGVLQRQQATLFTPKLPSPLQNAINATGFGPIAKIYLRWKTPWWDTNTKGFQFIWPGQFINCCDDDYPHLHDNSGGGPSRNKAPDMRQRWFKSITGFDPVLDSKTTLVGWLGGPEAIFVEHLSEQEIGEECVKQLSTFTNFDVPIPEKVVVTKWNSDEFVGGAYCYRSTAGDKIHGDITQALCKPVMQVDSDGNEKPVILLAGEALSKNHYSTIHGAYENGESQAAKIVDFFHKLGEIKKDYKISNKNTQQLFNGQLINNRNSTT